MDDPKKDQRLRQVREGAASTTIGRREFLAPALAAGMTLPVAKTLWSLERAASTSRKGGTFRVALHDGSSTDSLDPTTTSSFYMAQRSYAVRSYLTQITSKNLIGSDLPVAWESSPDARTWIFELAKGVEFHNGKLFTATDAVASLNYHRGPNSVSAAKALLADIDDIEADGSHRLVFRMAWGNADLPYLLSDYHLAMLPADREG
jgi:peptide/nickel transport system substrate-binding protein